MRKINEITVIGAYGGWNAGDEAILSSVMLLLKKVRPKFKISVISTTKAVTTEAQSDYDRQGVSVRPFIDIPNWIRAATGSQILIGGGQLLNGSRRPRSLLFIFITVLINRICGRSPFIMGVGTHNIFYNMSSRLLARGICNFAKYVVVRDEQSKNSLANMGINGSKIDVVPDFVLSGIISKDEAPTFNKELLIFAPQMDPDDTHFGLDAVMEYVSVIKNAFGSDKFIISAHDVRRNFDAGLLDQILSRDGNLKGRILRHRHQTDELYRSAKLVISSRMHPIILGIISGSYVIGISGSAKLRDLASRYGFPMVESPSELADLLSHKPDFDQNQDDEIEKEIAHNRDIILDKLDKLLIRT